MNTVYRINCEDKKELLKAFVTSKNLVKPEEVITSFSSRGSFIVTKKNNRHVPESSLIATASGIAVIAGSKVRVAISVADNKPAEIKVLGKTSSESDACVGSFIEELEEKGFKVS